MANELEKTLLGTSKRSVNNTIDKNSTYIEQKKLHKVFVQEEDPGEVEDGCIWFDNSKQKIVKSFPIQIKFEIQGEGSSEMGGLAVGYVIDREKIQNPIYITGSNTYCLDIQEYSNVFELSGFGGSDDSYKVYYYLGIRKVINGEIVLCTSQDTTQFNTHVYFMNGGTEETIIDYTAPFSYFTRRPSIINYGNVNDANIKTVIDNNFPTYLKISIVE